MMSVFAFAKAYITARYRDGGHYIIQIEKPDIE
jgi:hypothetical protein